MIIERKLEIQIAHFEQTSYVVDEKKPLWHYGLQDDDVGILQDMNVERARDILTKLENNNIPVVAFTIFEYCLQPPKRPIKNTYYYVASFSIDEYYLSGFDV